MNTGAINFKHPFIAGLHEIIMDVWSCCLCDIIGPKDTAEKFMAVFILVHFYGYRQRDVAVAYTVNFHFVPTAVDGVMKRYGESEVMRGIVQEILNKLDKYESLESSRE